MGAGGGVGVCLSVCLPSVYLFLFVHGVWLRMCVYVYLPVGVRVRTSAVLPLSLCVSVCVGVTLPGKRTLATADRSDGWMTGWLLSPSLSLPLSTPSLTLSLSHTHTYISPPTPPHPLRPPTLTHTRGCDVSICLYLCTDGCRPTILRILGGSGEMR